MKIGLNGNLVNYVSAGSGPPVILIHGMAASLHQWDRLIPELASLGFQAYALDLLGHGGSSKPAQASDYHMDRLYQHLDAWIQALGLTQPPVLVGHSLGGYLSLCYALRNPEQVQGLLLLNAFYSPRQLSRFIRMSLKRPEVSVRVMRAAPRWTITSTLALGQLRQEGLPVETRRQIIQDYRRIAPEVLLFPRTVNDLTPYLSQVVPRTMVVWGEKDLTLHPTYYPLLAKAIPNSVPRPIPNSGHLLHLTRPDTFSRLVREFLMDRDEFH